MTTALYRSLAVTILGCSACDGITTEPFEYGRVTVEVTLPNGAGVPGLGLTLYSGTRHLSYAVTDASGGARFDFVPEGPMGVGTAPNPDHRSAAHPDGYFQTFSMREGQDVRLTFAFIERRGTIVLAVRDAAGAPRPDHDVELYDAWETLVRTRPDAQGEVVFEKVPEGDYGIRVFESLTCALPPDGYVYRDGLLVEPGARLEVVIELGGC